MNREFFVAKQNNAKLLLSTLFLITISAITFYYLYRGPDQNSLRVVLREGYLFYPMFGLGFVLFLALSVGGIYRLISGANGLRVDRDGINLNGSLLVKWNDIAALEHYEDFTSSHLTGYKIILKDPEGFLSAHKGHPLYKRMLANQKSISTPVAVYTNSLNMDHDEFNSVVGHFLRKNELR
ncbi:hypothetical protein G4G27_08180 [Sphingomonas sp. So64.6b]|uniref:STM3941 family protein n=1 Tax=Sphingomonas sp. So64.6b TaxID=2997354 RepID=UPI001602FED4|nr:STM3941 family protein [Sphingomonas sp. So64.6b]QNA83967.1 hypothetical protein G4G27_08180 [Sphingomonas sp. So64.6b]